MIRFVGLDLHPDSLQASCHGPDGKRLATHRVACTRAALEAFAAAHLTKEDHLVLEATSHCWPVVELLRPYVARVVVSNPRQTKAIAQAKIKTDKIDAQVLAHLLRCDYIPEVWTPDPDTRHLRGLCSRRASLVRQRTAVKNRIHSVLVRELLPRYEGDLYSQAGREWLARQALAPLSRAAVESDLRLLKALEAELETLAGVLAPLAYQDERVKLAMTLVGWDYTVAQTVLAALGDHSRFCDGDHAAGYLGLAPSTKQSGNHTHHGPITKQGNRKARWLIVQAAQHAATHPGPLGVFFRRLQKKRGRNVAVVATARKMVVILYHMLKNNEPYRYAQPVATQNKLRQLRIKAAGERRKRGPQPGTAPAANRGTGVRTRTVPSLPQVYESEGLPAAQAPAQLPRGERRMLAETGAAEFVATLQQPQRRLRKPPAATPSATPAPG